MAMIMFFAMVINIGDCPFHTVEIYLPDWYHSLFVSMVGGNSGNSRHDGVTLIAVGSLVVGGNGLFPGYASVHEESDGSDGVHRPLLNIILRIGRFHRQVW